MEKVFICVARGRAKDDWEASCLDLDIAVQGRSLDEVRAKLDTAVTTYVADALNEQEPDRSALLNRRAPLGVRLKWLWPFIVHTLFDRSHDGDSSVGFQVECRA